MDNILTVTEFASKAGISPRTVYRMIQNGTIESQKSERDKRRSVIPRAELDRLFSARQEAEIRAYVAGGAAGVLDARWRSGYRKAVRVMADAGDALASHLREMEPEQPDTEAEHKPDHCERCEAIVGQIAKAIETARQCAVLAPIADEFYRELREAGRVADEAHTALREDQPDA